MPIHLALKAVERNTYFVTIGFKDENEAAVVPTSISWTLKDNLGQIVNSRSAVSFTPVASTITIVLSGNDLVYSRGGDSRTLTIEAVYNSSFGNGLPLRGSVLFPIEPL